jgi:NitT/TauT family transport system permease protein
MTPASPSYSSRGWLGRPRVSPIDVVVAAGTVVLLWGVIRLEQAMGAPSARLTGSVSLGISHLPYYAARSLLRMFLAYALSLLFTFAYGTAAARSRRWRGVLIPLLDILQSVPVLGFLTITVTFFVGLFPGSELGLECAAIFAIFTSQAWNMTFSFYHSLMAQPTDLDEAVRIFRLTKWERFWRLDVPSSMIGLVWNSMMSFGGGWFFLAASEILIVSGRSKALPGIGSYMQTAEAARDIPAIWAAIGVMIVMIIVVNTLFWRPIVAWAEKFRMESSAAEQAPRSATLDLLRRSHGPAVAGALFRPFGRLLDRVTRPFGLAERPLKANQRRRRAGDIAFAAVFCALLGLGLWGALAYFAKRGVASQFPYCFGLGLITLSRVVVLVVVCSLVWVPIGAVIGMNPVLSRRVQPVVQVLASFPALFLFPLVIILFQHLGITLDYGGILLMALGTQWYILFNVIAGASAIPTDLRQMTCQFRFPRRQEWRELILPAIFPYYVTGGISAAGGAWNASIVAEYVTYGSKPLVARGLGAYITQASIHSDLPEVLVGVVVMSVYVVVINVSVWQPLYRLAETRYKL